MSMSDIWKIMNELNVTLKQFNIFRSCMTKIDNLASRNFYYNQQQIHFNDLDFQKEGSVGESD